MYVGLYTWRMQYGTRVMIYVWSKTWAINHRGTPPVWGHNKSHPTRSIPNFMNPNRGWFMIGFSSLSIWSSSSRCKWQNIKQQMSGVPLENWEPPKARKEKSTHGWYLFQHQLKLLQLATKQLRWKETVIVWIPSKMTKPMNLWVRTMVVSASLHQTQLRFRKKICTPQHGPMVCAKIPTRKDVRLFQGCLGLWIFFRSNVMAWVVQRFCRRLSY